MASNARSGFHFTNEGINFWFLDDEDVANFVGPVTAIEAATGPNRFDLLSSDGKRFPTTLSPQLQTEYQRLGGKIREQPRADGGWFGLKKLFGGPTAKPILWKGRGETIAFGSFRIADPLTYFSEGTPAEEEASCIDMTLPVGRPVKEARGALGYWPQYRTLTPDQRANYLAWLAGGRKDALDDIGYAFIYFYGLERRLLLDQQDINIVTREILRLQNVYTTSGALTGYLSRLIAYLTARVGLEKLSAEGFAMIFERGPMHVDEEMLGLATAWMMRQKKPVPAGWAYLLARQHPQASRSTVIERALEEFISLFKKRYQEAQGEGIFLKAARRDRTIGYKQPASPSLLALRELNSTFADSVPIPHVLGLQSQFMPLVKIWSACIDELKPLSRHLARGREAGTREAWELLPPTLRKEVDHPDKPKWEQVVTRHADEEGLVLLPVSELAPLQEIKTRPRLTIKQSQGLVQTAEVVGLAVEPDARMTGRAYAWDELVAIYRPDGAEQGTDTGGYAGAALLLELGMAVAAADGVITDDEVAHIMRFLESQFAFDQAQTRRLEQRRHVLQRQHPSLTRLGKRLATALAVEQRERLGQFLVGLAASNGELNEPTLAAVKKAHKALGINAALLDSLVDHLRSSCQAAPGIAQAGQPSVAAEIVLNQDLVRQILADTQAVAGMLSKVLQDADEPPAWTVKPKPAAPGANRFTGLPASYQPLATALLAQKEWGRAAFQEEVRRHRLMPSAALDRINEWAMENFEDVLILEQGDRLVIQFGLLQDQA